MRRPSTHQAVIRTAFNAWRLEHIERAAVPRDVCMPEVIVARWRRTGHSVGKHRQARSASLQSHEAAMAPSPTRHEGLT
jgi:hypothetical protein